MSVIDHGKWVPYVPSPMPAKYPSGALFLKRESDDQDWYQYIYREEVTQPIGSDAFGTPIYPPGPAVKDVITDTFANEHVKCASLFQPAYNSHIIGAAVYDVAMLFPANQIVFEITDYAGTDPQGDLGNKAYDPITKTIADPALVMYRLPRAKVVERINAAGKFNQLKAYLNSHALESELWYGSSELEPTNPLILAILADIGADPAVIMAPPT